MQPIRKYWAAKPDHEQAQRDLLSLQFNNLAITLQGERKYAAAMALLQRAVASNPADEWARLNLAVMLSQADRHDEALALANLPVQRDDYKIHQVRAFAHLAKGEIEEAIAEARLNDAMDAANVSGQFFEGSTILSTGDWERGLPKLYQVATSIIGWDGKTPWWDGNRVEKLLLIADQGMGDIINFVRYIPWAAKRCKELTFAVPNAAFRILHKYQKYGPMVEQGRAVEATAKIPLSGLPYLADTRPDTIPPDPGLLHADGFAFPPKQRGRLRVGIVWAGNASYARDRWRSTTLEAMLPLAADPRFDLFSLQAGPRSADINQAQAQALVTDLSGRVMTEWSICAGAINALDAIVTVDTAIAHIAGALGKRCYLLLGMLPDWRWLRGRDDTPWYPRTRLVRQSKTGEWGDVIDRVGNMLVGDL